MFITMYEWEPWLQIVFVRFILGQNIQLILKKVYWIAKT